MDLGKALDEAKDCPYCMGEENKGEKLCSASAYPQLLCTRSEGHEGDHMACGFSGHPLKKWGRKI